MAKRIRQKHLIKFDQVSNRWDIEGIIMCDTSSDLPTKEEFDGYRLVAGTLAIDISTGDRYRITSDGNWDKQSG